MSEKKWNQEHRRFIYRRVFAAFGDVGGWVLHSWPKGKKKEFDTLIEEIRLDLKSVFALEVSCKAITNQLNWGIQPNQRVIKNSGMIQNWIHNRSAALEVGLIKSANLPSTMMLH